MRSIDNCVLGIKTQLAKGNFNGLHILSEGIQAGIFIEKDFTSFFHDYKKYEIDASLGTFSAEKEDVILKQLATRLLKLINNYIDKKQIGESLSTEEAQIAYSLLKKGEQESCIKFLIDKISDFPVAVQDRITLLGFELSSLNIKIMRGLLHPSQGNIVRAKITEGLVKLIDKLTEVEQFHYYNSNALVFVIISFQESMDNIYSCIKRVGESYNLNPLRTKDVQGDYQVTEKIIELIENAEFVIVDLSFERPNVYFELGYARAIEKKVITICNLSSEIHFDVKDWNCMYYSDEADLERNLSLRLKSELTEGK